MLGDEKKELERMIEDKDKDNDEMRQKLHRNKEKIGQANNDYQGVRDNNDGVVNKNEMLKNEIVELEDRVAEEKSKS